MKTLKIVVIWKKKKEKVSTILWKLWKKKQAVEIIWQKSKKIIAQAKIIKNLMKTLKIRASSKAQELLCK